VTAAAPALASSKVADLLAADVKRGAVVVTEEAGRTTIALSDSNQFASGGVDLEAKLRPVLLNVAAALDKTTGPIVVIGHADANPSSNPRFPTNQALSAARAESAAKAMKPGLKDAKRLTSEGAGDAQPLGPSDTAANRARNRRVVVVLKSGS
jgi:type VI secretion system protein ImpK